MNPPRVGITMGDPTGIGPEITRVALARLHGKADFTVYAPGGLYGAIRGLRVVPPDPADPVRDAIELAAQELRDGTVDAVVTAPVSKRCFRGDFPGHTELFADRLGAPDVAMMLAGPRLRVVPLTTHVPIRDVADLLSIPLVLRTTRLVARALRTGFGFATPRIALTGLNPHAGDGGLFGDEEPRILAPAAAQLREEGLDVSGPLSPDTAYYQASQGRYDVVIAPYHDQALVPFKLLHFSDGVNITLGLGRPRTSPDHGPAYDIVGTSQIDPSSMIAAVETAIMLAAGSSDAPGRRAPSSERLDLS